jgi:hypothetical protein
MAPESIEALRAVIAEHEIVEVEWHDPRTVSHAPWTCIADPKICGERRRRRERRKTRAA